jgi:dihydroceramide fatty acyl 2-hydroxylase
MVALAAALGAFTWTFLEYLIHRWMGHDRRFRKSPFGLEHTRHHIEGDYFAPTWKKAVFVAVIAPLLCVPAVALAGIALGVAYVCGLVALYGFYEVLHRREHTHAGIGPYGRWARRHHFTHHFVDARVNHGVTTPVWDWVFRTYRKPGIIRVPARLRMRWLTDPETGGVPAAWAGTFVVSDAPDARG